MSQPLPRVGVVTVTYNSESVLEDFLVSLAGQRGVNLSTYVIDNDSQDASVEMVTNAVGLDFRKIIVNEANLGVAEANNQGIEAALNDQCEWVLLLNNDTVFPSDLIATLVTEATSNGLQLLSPVIEAADPSGTIWYCQGRYLPWQGFRTYHPLQGEPLSAASDRLTKTQYASTCCLLVHKSVFSTIGLMDPNYFVYFDDVDFAVRANRAGYAYWVTPITTLLHKASSMTGGLDSPFSRKWGSRNWVLISRKNHRGVMRLWSYAVILVRSFIRFLSGRDSASQYRERLRAFYEGWTTPIATAPFPKNS